jgi:hypothetical protein
MLVLESQWGQWYRLVEELLVIPALVGQLEPLLWQQQM